MAQPPVIYKPGRLNNLWNYLGSSLKSFAQVFKPYLNSVTDIVDVTYDEMYNLCVNGKLTPGTKYRVPYKAVNFINGYISTRQYIDGGSIIPGDVDGKFFSKVWEQGLLYPGSAVISVIQDPDTLDIYYTDDADNIVKLDSQGNLISSFNVKINDTTYVGVTAKCIHQGGLIVFNSLSQSIYYNGNVPVTYCKSNTLIKLKSNGDLDYDFLNNAVGYANGFVTQVKTFGPDNDKILVVGSFTEIGITSSYSGGDGILDFTYTKPTGTDGTYSGVTVYTLTGSGNGASAEVYVKNNKVQSVQLSELGEFYAIGDALYIDAGDFGGSETIQITVTKVRPKQIVSYMVALNADGTIYQDFMDAVALNPPAQDIAPCLIDSNGDIVVGGNNGWIGKYSAIGVFDATFDTNTGTKADGSINGIAQTSGGEYVIVGSFSDFDSNSVGNIAVLDQDGTYNGSFFSGMSSQFNGGVDGITPNGCVWGGFTDYDGTVAYNIAKLDLGAIQNITPLDYRYNPGQTIYNIIDDLSLDSFGNTPWAFVCGSYNLMSGPNGQGTDSVPNVTDIMKLVKIWVQPGAIPYLDSDGIKEVHVSNIQEHIVVTAATKYVTETAAYSEEFPHHKIDFIPWHNKLCLNSTSSGEYNGDAVLEWDGQHPYIQIINPNKQIRFGLPLRININGAFGEQTEIDFTVFSVRPGPFYADNPYDAEVPPRYTRLQVSSDGKRITFLDWTYDEYIKIERDNITGTVNGFYLDYFSEAVADAYGYISRREDPMTNIALPCDWIGMKYRRYWTPGEYIESQFFTSGATQTNGFYGVAVPNYIYPKVFQQTTWYVDHPVVAWNYKEELTSIVWPGNAAPIGFIGNAPRFDNIVFMDEIRELTFSNKWQYCHSLTFRNIQNSFIDSYYMENVTIRTINTSSIKASNISNSFFSNSEDIHLRFYGVQGASLSNTYSIVMPNTAQYLSPGVFRLDTNSFINSATITNTLSGVRFPVTILTDTSGPGISFIAQWYDTTAGGINYANAI